MNQPNPHRRAELMTVVVLELQRAYAKHGSEPWTRHEFLGILREEYLELEQAIFTDAPSDRVLAELVQVVAMCFRFLETGDRQRGVLPRLRLSVPGSFAEPLYRAVSVSEEGERGPHFIRRRDGLEVESLAIRNSHVGAALSFEVATGLAALLSAEEGGRS